MGLDGRVEQHKMPLDGGRHRRAVPLPERGAAFDVGEEESDSALRQLGHDASFSRNDAGSYTGYLALFSRRCFWPVHPGVS